MTVNTAPVENLLSVLNPEPPREVHRSFTLRVPMSMYLKMSTMAQADGMYLNQKANQLLQLGMGQHINLDDALARLLRAHVTEEAKIDD